MSLGLIFVYSGTDHKGYVSELTNHWQTVYKLGSRELGEMRNKVDFINVDWISKHPFQDELLQQLRPKSLPALFIVQITGPSTVEDIYGVFYGKPTFEELGEVLDGKFEDSRAEDLRPPVEPEEDSLFKPVTQIERPRRDRRWMVPVGIVTVLFLGFISFKSK